MTGTCYRVLMMYNYTMYVIEDVEHCIIAANKDIYDFVIDDEECKNCGMVVGPYDDMFFPCVILVGEEEEESWPICVECAAPLLYPREWIVELDI